MAITLRLLFCVHVVNGFWGCYCQFHLNIHHYILHMKPVINYWDDKMVLFCLYYYLGSPMYIAPNWNTASTYEYNRTNQLFDNDVTSCLPVSWLFERGDKFQQTKLLFSKQYLFRGIFLIHIATIGPLPCSPRSGITVELASNGTRLPCTALKETVAHDYNTCHARCERWSSWDSVLLTLWHMDENYIDLSEICEISLSNWM